MKPLIEDVSDMEVKLSMNSVLESGRLVAGGGAVEAALNVYLETFATTLVRDYGRSGSQTDHIISRSHLASSSPSPNSHRHSLSSPRRWRAMRPGEQKWIREIDLMTLGMSGNFVLEDL